MFTISLKKSIEINTLYIGLKEAQSFSWSAGKGYDEARIQALANSTSWNTLTEKFEWTDELLRLAFWNGKFIENKHGVILYQVVNTIYVVDESHNIYYGEVSIVAQDHRICVPNTGKWKIEMITNDTGYSRHIMSYTPWKWAKLQKVDEYLQKKRDAVWKAQEQTRIRASLGSIIGSWVAIPASANNIEIQWEEMQYIQQIYDMEIDVGWMKTSIRKLLEEIDKNEDNVIALRNTVGFLKKTEPFSHFPWIFEYFEVIIQDKVNQIELSRWYIRIDEMSSLLENDTIGIAILAGFARELALWLETRAKNPLPTGAKERDASNLLEVIQKRIDTAKVSEQWTLIQSFEWYEQEIINYLDNVLYIEHIAQIYNEEAYKWATELLALLPDDIARTKRWDLARIISARRNILERDKEEKIKKQAETRIMLLRDIHTNISELQDLVKWLQNEWDILLVKRENWLVKSTEDLIWQLSADEAQKLHGEFIQIFDERIASIKLTENIFHRTEWKIDLWKGSQATVFEAEKTNTIKWEIVGKKSWDEIIISFQNNVGCTIEPPITKQYRNKNALAVQKKDFAELQEYVMRWNTRYRAEFFAALSRVKKAETELQLNPDDTELNSSLDDARTKFESLSEKSYLARIFHHLPKHNLSSRPLVPHLYPGTVIGPTTELFLQNFADLAEKQIESQGKWSGIIIIEGDAGTWKNFKIDIYAHMTNREVFEMQGNKTAQKEDILYSYELWVDWTYRLPSHLIRGIQTPWAIVVLDEINTYPPEILKLLNPLLDGRRYINDPQFGKIKVHSSVLLVWLMNPQHYLWTTPLSPEIKSRARMMKDTYPAFKLTDNILSWEEAYLITRHMSRVESVRKMDQNTFISLWNASINNIDKWSQPAENLMKIFDDVAGYISFANSMRWIYQKTMMGTGNEEFHYPVSLREGIQVIEEYERNGNLMGRAIYDVIVPKISGKNVDVWAEIKVIETKISKAF